MMATYLMNREFNLPFLCFFYHDTLYLRNKMGLCSVIKAIVDIVYIWTPISFFHRDIQSSWIRVHFIGDFDRQYKFDGKIDKL